MTIDFRATIATNLGVCISGDIGSNLISDGSGLVTTQGRLVMDGIVNPARGAVVEILIIRQQLGIITRFPKPLYVVRALPDAINRQSEIEVGCRLTLMQNRKDKITYTNTPISAQALLQYCCQQIGLSLSGSSRPLTAQFARDEVDLSVGYVQVIGDLIKSESCVGRILPDGSLQVVELNLTRGGSGPVLYQDDLFSVEPITAGADPPDNWTVTYQAIEDAPGEDEEPPPGLDWTRSETISPPQEIVVRHKDWSLALGDDIPDRFTTTTFTVIRRSETETTFEPFFYIDAEGIERSSEVATVKVETNSSPGVAVNTAYAAYRLSRRLIVSMPEATEVTTTVYEYRPSATGPVLVGEESETEITELELAGSLNVPEYESYIPSGALFVAARRKIKYETQIGFGRREVTRTTTETWRCNGRRSEGQTAFAKIIDETSTYWQGGSGIFIAGAVSEMKELVYEGAEVTIATGRASVPQKPSESGVLVDDDENEISHTVSGIVLFQGATYDAGNNTETATYDMPYTTDGPAAEASAERYGTSQSGLVIGHAFGQNIVTAYDKVPTLDMAPIYLRIAGIEGAFLMDGTSYAWDGNGLVVAADLMLVGVTGYYGPAPPPSSWLRLPVPTLGLPKID